MTGKRGSKRRQAAGAARRVAVAYRANREDLEPLLRLVADVLAVASLACRRRDESAGAPKTEGAAP
jgi:uncharacterized protein (UPF0264 family)